MSPDALFVAFPRLLVGLAAATVVLVEPADLEKAGHFVLDQSVSLIKTAGTSIKANLKEIKDAPPLAGQSAETTT